LDSIEIEYNKVNLDKVTINIYKYGGDGQDYTYVYHYDGDEFFKIDFEKRIEKAIAKLKKKALIDNIRLEHILNVKLKYEKK
jgi:predicted alpha/beta superfamily hydrolase